MRRSLLSTGALLALVMAALPAEARPFRVNDIPNGSKYGCLNCHTDTKATANTDFGSDARKFLIVSGAISTQHVDWTPLCPLDSDGDGWTNGQELGDPDCMWKSGDPDPTGKALSNPGNPDSYLPPTCGNGKLEAGEPCEGTMLSKADCAEAELGTGPLSCTADCQFDTSKCEAASSSSSSSGGGATPPAEEEGGCSASGGAAPSGALMLGSGFLLLLAGVRRRKRPTG
jgi:hypothetical protein